MENTNIEMDDVKEYRPRKRDPAKTSVRFQDNYNVSPGASNKLMDKDEILAATASSISTAAS